MSTVPQHWSSYMTTFRWIGQHSEVAALLLIVGCGGSSHDATQAMPGLGADTASSARASTGRVAMPFVSSLANDVFLHRPLIDNSVRGTIVRAGPKCKATQTGLTLASNNTTGALDVFCGAMSGRRIANGAKPFETIGGIAGWGVAVHGGRIAVGTSGIGSSPSTINLYTLPTFTQRAVATLVHLGDNAYGVAFDQSGGLYATEWPDAYVDYWAGPSPHGPPSCQWHTTVNKVDYFVAAHDGPANSVVVYGIDGSGSYGNVDTELVTNMSPSCGTPPITDTLVQTFGKVLSGAAFPGGIVSDKAGELYVNNQYGTLYDDGPYPGGTISASCTWGYNPNDVTSIGMASNQHSIWATNLYFGGLKLQTFLESFKSADLSGSCVKGPAGGPTADVTNDEYFGVASWPDSGN
jgi:hypothetical protein